MLPAHCSHCSHCSVFFSFFLRRGYQETRAAKIIKKQKKQKSKKQKRKKKKKKAKKRKKKENEKKKTKKRKRKKKEKKMDLCGLARVLSDAMGVRFTESDIRRALGRHRVRGSNNFVVCVVPSGPSVPSGVLEYGIAERSQRSHAEQSQGSHAETSPADRYAVALRVALGETDEEEVEMERIFGQHAFERGFGLEPLFSGNLHTPTRGLRSASCWPWGVCLHTLRSEETERTYGEAGAEIARALRRASETVLALDACAVRNHVLARGEWCLIDFDPYFTKVAETDAQRAAARGFVAVQMLMLGSQMPGLFTLDDIAKETERSERGEAGEAGGADRREEERSEEDRSEEDQMDRREEERSEEDRRKEDRRKEDQMDRRETERSEEGEGPRDKRHRKCSGTSSDTYDLSSSSADDPADHVGPADLADLAGADGPVGPADPADHVGPSDPADPAGADGPVRPDGPSDPAGADGPAGPADPMDLDEDPVAREDLARDLVARVVRVAASFPDAARALACVIQMYGAYGMVGVARKAARRAMADANKPDSVDALVRAGLGETHASLFVRAALGLIGPEEFEEVYAARIAAFFRPSGPTGPSGPSGPSGPPSGPSP